MASLSKSGPLLLASLTVASIIVSFLPHIEALQCYNGCGLKAENSPYCTYHENAFLAVNEYSNGAIQECPKEATVCSEVVMFEPKEQYSFTMRGCDIPANCDARREMFYAKYTVPNAGFIKSHYCCETTLCNGAVKANIGLSMWMLGVVSFILAAKLNLQ